MPIYVPYTLVPSLAGNTSFDQVYIEAGTISSGTLSLNLIGNNPNMSYVFDYAASQWPLAERWWSVRTCRSLVESTLSDAGAVTFSSGDQVTVYNTAISVSGSLTANGTNFINDGGAPSITFASTATLSGGSNSFNLPIYVPYTLVASLAGNTSFDQVYIEAGTISSGTLSLNLIGNNPNMSYVFDSAASQWPLAERWWSVRTCRCWWSRTLSDAGAVTFSSGDQVTVYNTAISVSGSLTANGTNFINDGGAPSITFSFVRNAQWGQQQLQLADLRSLHAGRLARGQYQLRSGLYRSGHHLQRHPVAQPDRQQPEHELCVRLCASQWPLAERWWSVRTCRCWWSRR